MRISPESREALLKPRRDPLPTRHSEKDGNAYIAARRMHASLFRPSVSLPFSFLTHSSAAPSLYTVIMSESTVVFPLLSLYKFSVRRLSSYIISSHSVGQETKQVTAGRTSKPYPPLLKTRNVKIQTSLRTVPVVKNEMVYSSWTVRCHSRV